MNRRSFLSMLAGVFAGRKLPAANPRRAIVVVPRKYGMSYGIMTSSEARTVWTDPPICPENMDLQRFMNHFTNCHLEMMEAIHADLSKKIIPYRLPVRFDPARLPL